MSSESEARDAITLGADVGGKDAHAFTHEHILALRKLLQQECQGPYSRTVKEFAIILRIDGSVQSWSRSGTESVALQGRSTYATADIFVPKEAWSGVNSSSFRRFLAAEVRNALIKIAVFVQGRKVPVSIDRLTHDVDIAIEKFLA